MQTKQFHVILTHCSHVFLLRPRPLVPSTTNFFYLGKHFLIFWWLSWWHSLILWWLSWWVLLISLFCLGSSHRSRHREKVKDSLQIDGTVLGWRYFHNKRAFRWDLSHSQPRSRPSARPTDVEFQRPRTRRGRFDHATVADRIFGSSYHAPGRQRQCTGVWRPQIDRLCAGTFQIRHVMVDFIYSIIVSVKDFNTWLEKF